MNVAARISITVGMGLIVLSAAGCRQPEGTLPTVEGEYVNKVGDVGRDLQNLSEKTPEATADLKDDLENLSPDDPPEEQVGRLTQALAGALSSRRPTDDSAQAVARSLFVVMYARDLSERQIADLQRTISADLTAAGAEDAALVPVRDAVVAVQSAVTRNKRRWYHFF